MKTRILDAILDRAVVPALAALFLVLIAAEYFGARKRGRR